MARIGIDFGTTSSVMAVVQGGELKVLPSKGGSRRMRSAVTFLEGDSGESEKLVGDIADEHLEIAPEDTILSVKRLLGRGMDDPEVQHVQERYGYSLVAPSNGTPESLRILVGEKEYSPVEIATLLLQKLKEDAEFRLGEEVTHAVITVPAYFNQAQRASLRQAGRVAGLTVTKILDEPTAAAFTYFREQSAVVQQTGDSPLLLLVYDLGGGTFDLSVMLMTANRMKPLNLEGDMWLGGDDFDQKIIDWALGHLEDWESLEEKERRQIFAKMRKVARNAKERLTDVSWTTVLLPVSPIGSDGVRRIIRLTLTRTVFEKMIEPLVDRTIDLARTAVEKAGLTPEEIGRVLMVGSASRIPLVQRKVEALFGLEKVVHCLDEKECVALGAAIVGERIDTQIECLAPHPEFPGQVCGTMNAIANVFCERCKAPLAGDDGVPSISPFYYGILSIIDGFRIYIRKGEPCPTVAPQTYAFATRMEGQRILRVPIRGGASEATAEEEKHGEAYALLPPGLPAGTAVSITLRLDRDGIFSLEATLSDGNKLAHGLMKGESNHKMVGVLERLEVEIARNVLKMRPTQAVEVEKHHEQIFIAWADQRFEEVEQRAAELFLLLREEEEEDKDAGLTRGDARALISRIRRMVELYGWDMDRKTHADPLIDLTYLLEEVLDETADTPEDVRWRELAVALDHRKQEKISEVISTMMTIRRRIFGTLMAANRAQANEFLKRLGEINSRLQMRSEAGALNLLAELDKETEEALPRRSEDEEEMWVCPSGHKNLPQTFNCSECGYDFGTV